MKKQSKVTLNNTGYKEYLDNIISSGDMKTFGDIDLRTCSQGDILLGAHGAELEYICPTPWKHLTYLDHVIRYIKDKDGNSMGEYNYGTRTHDGFVFAKNRIPATDEDIVLIIKKHEYL
jgi:hypothetical protein